MAEDPAIAAWLQRAAAGRIGGGSQVAEDIGRFGEQLACMRLQQQPGVLSVHWVNERFESGLPYDIVYHRRVAPDPAAASPLVLALAGGMGGGGVEEVFVEVKSTSSPYCQTPFQLSLAEAVLAYQLGPRYEVLRVFGVPASPHCSIMRNLSLMLTTGASQLHVVPRVIPTPLLPYTAPDAGFGDGGGGGLSQ